MSRIAWIVCFGVPVFCGDFALAQTNTGRGIGIGGITGAVVGGIIGHQNDETAEGALIGGAVGAVAGGLVGHHRDAQQPSAWQYYQPPIHQHYVPPALTVAPHPTTLSDIVMMSRNGLSDVTIVNHLRQTGWARPLLAADVVYLHQQGVSELVINAMQHMAIYPQRAFAPAVVPVRVASPPRIPYYSAHPGCGHRSCW